MTAFTVIVAPLVSMGSASVLLKFTDSTCPEPYCVHVVPVKLTVQAAQPFSHGVPAAD